MAYKKVLIEKLGSKVIALFDELKADNRLREDEFIKAFKNKYPDDYALLVYEWEIKVREFKKNRRGQPKSHPVRPDKILSNMYKNYFFKLIKNPKRKNEKFKEESLQELRILAGKYGYKIKSVKGDKYNVVNKQSKEVEYSCITCDEVKKIFSPQGLSEIINKKNKEASINDT